MLTEEAHHMFVGDTGISRVLQRTAEVMTRDNIDDPAQARTRGVIDLPTMQRYLNFHFSVTLDLFGSEVSSNGATFYTSGLKGRFMEERIDDDHRLLDAEYKVQEVDNDHIIERGASAVTAVNERLRDDYINEVRHGIARWNKTIERAGVNFRLQLPHKGFNRRIGNFSGARIAPDGTVITDAQWRARHHEWLPTEADRAYVISLMGRVAEPGKFANWIAPPARGINNQPIDFEYVRFN
jgi:benzoyl-CoA 2,3-dioxygenase component B